MRRQEEFTSRKQFQAPDVSSKAFVLWIIYLAQKIHRPCQFLLTKALNRQACNIRQFKKSKKYQIYKSRRFPHLLKEYLVGTRQTKTLTNPIEKFLIEYLINFQKGVKPQTFEDLKFTLDQLSIKQHHLQEQSYNIKRRSSKMTTKFQDELITINNTKIQYIPDQQSPVKMQKHNLNDLLNFSLNMCMKISPILRRIQQKHSQIPFNQIELPHIYKIVKEISTHHHQINSLINKLQHQFEGYL